MHSIKRSKLDLRAPTHTVLAAPAPTPTMTNHTVTSEDAVCDGGTDIVFNVLLPLLVLCLSKLQTAVASQVVLLMLVETNQPYFFVVFSAGHWSCTDSKGHEACLTSKEGNCHWLDITVWGHGMWDCLSVRIVGCSDKFGMKGGSRCPPDSHHFGLLLHLVSWFHSPCLRLQ